MKASELPIEWYLELFNEFFNYVSITGLFNYLIVHYYCFLSLDTSLFGLRALFSFSKMAPISSLNSFCLSVRRRYLLLVSFY